MTQRVLNINIIYLILRNLRIIYKGIIINRILILIIESFIVIIWYSLTINIILLIRISLIWLWYLNIFGFSVIWRIYDWILICLVVCYNSNCLYPISSRLITRLSWNIILNHLYSLRIIYSILRIRIILINDNLIILICLFRFILQCILLEWIII